MGEPKAETAPQPVDVKTLHAKIGELTLDRDFLSGALGNRIAGRNPFRIALEAVEKALAKYGKPEISSQCAALSRQLGQGSQFTSLAFTELLKSHKIDISMDGKGAWRDNHASRNAFGIRGAALANH